MPKRIQRKRTKGWKMPKGAVCVTRGTKWGNPYRVHRGTFCWEVMRGNLRYWPPCGTRKEARALAVRFYETRYLRRRLREAAKDQLRGKTLCCWCRLDQICHADVLLEVANQ
jgi:hypothetical protein